MCPITSSFCFDTLKCLTVFYILKCLTVLGVFKFLTVFDILVPRLSETTIDVPGATRYGGCDSHSKKKWESQIASSNEKCQSLAETDFLSDGFKVYAPWIADLAWPMPDMISMVYDYGTRKSLNGPRRCLRVSIGNAQNKIPGCENSRIETHLYIHMWDWLVFTITK